MDNDEGVRLEMPLPLDSDGFLRRECPTCEREFKWLHTPSEDSDDASESEAALADGGYFCPYCGIQAEPDTWLTKDQIELAENTVASQMFGPLAKAFGDSLKSSLRRSGGMFSADLNYEAPDQMDPLTEADDMKRVTFTCHPTEPVKVLDAWDRPVRCLVCGRPSE